MSANAPSLVWTDARCKLDDAPAPELPVLVDGAGHIVVSASNWFRSIYLSSRNSHSTVKQYAKQLRNFWHFLEARGLRWEAVDDPALRKWRNTSVVPGGIEEGSWNAKISVVYRFYLWAQNEGYIRDRIGTADWRTGVRFPIDIWLTENRQRRRSRGLHRVHSDLMYKVYEKPVKHVPTAEEMDTLYLNLAQASDPGIAARDILISTFSELVGLRRGEIAWLKLSDVPAAEQIDQLRLQNSVSGLRIVGKGNKARIVPVTYEVWERTAEYIEQYRPVAFRKSGIGEHGRLFVSHTTGRPLTVGAISNTIIRGFRESGLEGSPHALRRRNLSLIVRQTLHDALDQDGYAFSREMVLLKAKEIAGHESVSTLRYYLDLHMKDEVTELSSRTRGIDVLSVGDQHLTELVRALVNSIDEADHGRMMKLIGDIRNRGTLN